MKLAPIASLIAGIIVVGIACNKAETPVAVPTPSVTALTSPATYVAIDVLFQAQCFKCHGGKGNKGGLSLASYEHLMVGGADGKVVVAGDPDKSLLIAYLKGTKEPRMPSKAPPLSDSDIQAISDWIKAGAKQ